MSEKAAICGGNSILTLRICDDVGDFVCRKRGAVLLPLVDLREVDEREIPVATVQLVSAVISRLRDYILKRLKVLADCFARVAEPLLPLCQGF